MVVIFEVAPQAAPGNRSLLPAGLVQHVPGLVDGDMRNSSIVGETLS
jgi:hypothetical protein